MMATRPTPVPGQATMERATDFRGAGGGGGSSPQRTPDNLLSQDYVEIILGLCHGPIKGMVSDVAPHGPLENFFFGDTPLQNKADQKSNFSDFQVTAYNGTDSDPEIKRVLGGDASNLTVGTHMLQNTPVVRTTPSSLRKTDDFAGLDRLEVRILFNTIAKQNDEGVYNATAELRIEYKPSSSPTWLKYKDKDTTITGKTTTGYVKDFLLDVDPLVGDDYDVRVTKLSPDNGTETAIDFTWESLQMVTLAKPKYPGLAMLHIYGKVTAQFNSLPDMSSIQDLMIIQVPTNYNPYTRTYDEGTPWNGTFKNEWTDNPAWILYWLITNPEHGLAHYYNGISANRQEFYAAAKWCDEQVPSGVVGVTQPRFTFNELLNEQRMGLDLLKYVAGAFNATIYDPNQNGVIRLKTDQYTTPKQIFTPENITEQGFSYSFTDITSRVNDVTVQFINPELDWNTDERSASVDTSDWIEQNGRIPMDFTAVGCTNKHEAIRRANDRVITANTEITQVTFDTNRFGMLCELYDTIMVADPVSGWSTGGRIKSHAAGVIQLRDPIFFEATTPVEIMIQTYTGLVTLGVTPPSLGLVYSLNIIEGAYPSNIPDRPVFTVENLTNLGLAKPFRVASITEVEGNPDKYTITAIEINPTKYEDSANGTVSDPVQYDFETPGEPILPLELLVENMTPAVTSDGTLIYRVNAAWTRPFQAFTDYYELQFQEVDTSSWEVIKVYGENQEVKPLKDGKRYNFRLWAITPLGKRSSKAVTVRDFLVTKKNSILENVTGLALNQTNKGWQASWNPPTNVPDLAGTRIKFSNPPASWESLPNLYLSPSLTQDLPWFTSGDVRVQAKYINTSENESENPAVYNLTVLPPAQPDATAQLTFGTCEIIFTDCTTTQPLRQILVRKGSATSTWDTAIIAQFTLGANQRSFNVSPDATNETRVFIRGVDVAGNMGAATLVTVPAGANSVAELLDAVRGDIDETWITPGLLDHINYGDPDVPGGLAQRLANVESNSEVGVGQVLNPDPFLTNPDAWVTLSGTIQEVTLTDGKTGTSAFRFDNSAGTYSHIASKMLPSPVGRTIRVSAWARKLYGNTAGVFYLRLMCYNQSGGLTGYNIGVEGIELPSVWTRYTGNIVVPVDTVNMRIMVHSNYVAANDSRTEIQDVRAEDVTDAVNVSALVQTEIATRADQTGFLGAQWTTRVALTAGGQPVIGGISLAGYSSPTQGPTFDMSIRSNKVAFLPPAGLSADTPTYPFIYYTVATVLPSGITVQPGIYTKNAFIEYVTADQIDTRGITVKDYSGNVLFSATKNLDFSRMDGIPSTSNMMYNSAFDNGFHGWNGPAGSVAVNASGFNLDNIWCLSPVGAPGNNVFYARQLGRVGDPNSYFEYASSNMTIEGGKRYIVSGYSGAHRCTVAMFVRVFNAVGGLIADGQAFNTNAGEASGGNLLSGYKRQSGSFVAPTGAAFCAVVFRKYDTYAGQGDSYMFVTRFMLEETGPNGVTPGAWSEVPTDRTAVRTSNPISAGNVTTYIQGAAIGYAQIQYILANQIVTSSLSAISANIGFLTSRVGGVGPGYEQDNNGYRVYDGSSQLRYKAGKLN